MPKIHLLGKTKYVTGFSYLQMDYCDKACRLKSSGPFGSVKLSGVEKPCSVTKTKQ